MPPILPADQPALGATIVTDMATFAGWNADLIYAPLLLRPAFRDNQFLTYSAVAPAAFSWALRAHPDPPRLAQDMVDSLIHDGIRAHEWPEHPSEQTGPELLDLFHGYILEAERLTSSLVRTILSSSPRIVAFSIMVDAQKVPSAAIARRLRRAGYKGLLVAGGSALDGDMGPAFMRCFRSFDVALQGEAESNWLPFLKQVQNTTSDWRTTNTPGMITWLHNELRNVPISVPVSIWNLRPEAFGSFLKQRADAGGAATNLVLTAESSRGCWWADQLRCSFCAVDPEAHPYRVRPETEVADAVAEIWDRWHPTHVNMTDSCMPDPRKSGLLDALRDRSPHERWSLYYEVKSTTGRRDLARLRQAGVTEIQPGIESFCSATLKEFRKGATQLHNISLLKWSRAYGIRVNYPLMYGSPTETAAHLIQMTQLVQSLHHLDPPMHLNRLRLYRGNKYWTNSDAHGLGDVSPLKSDRLAYDTTEELLNKIVFNFNYSSPRHTSLKYMAALEELALAVNDWRLQSPLSALTLIDSGDVIVVTRLSPGGNALTVIDDPVEVALLRGCSEITSLKTLSRKLGIDLDDLLRANDRLCRARLIITERGCSLSLPTPLPTFRPETTSSSDPKQCSH